MRKKIYSKKNQIIITAIIIGSIAAGVLCAGFDEFQGNWINVTSFIISVIALIIALITYFTIDSVNSITTMEGNVLENENYTVAYTEMLRKFSGCETKKQFQDKLLEDLCSEVERNSNTCIQFADTLQGVIDHIIWFAYLDFADDDFKKRYNQMMERAEHRLIRYSELSNGIQYTLRENMKLIKYVFEYQMGSNQNPGYVSNLEDVRIRMIRNPISQIIYYDYLGLNYRRKAAELFKSCGSQATEFSAEYMKNIRNFNYTIETKRNIEVLLTRAETAFSKALVLANDNLLWKNYLLYNMVRTKIMTWMLSESEQMVSCELIDALLAETQRVRHETLFFYGNLAGGYLHSMFEGECRRIDMLINEFNNAKF